VNILFQKSNRAAREKNRAAAVAMNADVRRTKARLLEEVVKLQKIATKKVVTNFQRRIRMRILLFFEAKCMYQIGDANSDAGEGAVAGGEGVAG